MGKRISNIFIACIEALAAVAVVAVFAFELSGFNDACAYRSSRFYYQGQTSFDHAIVDSNGNEYPAGTVFEARTLYKDRHMDIFYDSKIVYKSEFDLNFDISDASNSDELNEALNQFVANEKQLLFKEAIKPAAFSMVVFIGLFVIFIIVNNNIKTLSWQIATLIIISISGMLFALCAQGVFAYLSKAHAPIIYLYPEEETEVNVKLTLDGKLTASYPRYNEDLGWTVTASPDGTLTDANGREYEYLFWEGDLAIKPDLTHGFCVKGEDTAEFLEDSLAKLGLTDKEADTFIMYWLPQLESNKYNVITFQTEAYEDAASLEITPAPDTVIRVNMLWYPVNSYVDMEPQGLESLNPDTREGFTVVEWGGEKYERGILGLFVR